MKYKLLLSLIFIAGIASAQSGVVKHRADSLRRQLHYANTAKDSIKILYDIFDTENSSASRRINGKELYDVAKRSKQTNVCLDMLRQRAAASSKDRKALLALRKEAGLLKSSPEVEDTKLFLDLYIIMNEVRNSSDNVRRQNLTNLIARADIGKGSWHSQVKDLYYVCAYLSVEGTPNLLADYLEKLESKINERKDLHYSIKNFYYTAAAIHYMEAGRPFRAVDADKKLLRIISGLEKEYKGKNRKFRNYDVQKYVSYRRMLFNHKALTPEEVKGYYMAALRLKNTNPTVAADFAATPRTEAFYAFASNDYKKALPLLKKVKEMSDSNNIALQRGLLEMIIEAAKATGDNSTANDAITKLETLLENSRTAQNQNLYTELQIKYDVNELQTRNAALEIEKRDNEIAATRNVVWIISAAFFVVLVLVIILYYYYRHARALSRHLSDAVKRLERERDTLNKIQTQLIKARDRAEAANVAKDEFLHSMSHEIRTPLNAIMGFSRLIVNKVPDTLVPKLKNFSNQIVFNTELLEVLINDILYLSSIDTHSPEPSAETTSASTLLSLAAQWASHKVKPGVYVDCRLPSPDIQIRSDRGSIEEVLMKMLSNAAKFTINGSIILECRENKDAGTVSFIITDTGSGIPEGHEEEIFDRFVKLDTFQQGTGLGLYICRRLAETLGGTIYVDKKYRSGARFIFTIPKNISND